MISVVNPSDLINIITRSKEAFDIGTNDVVMVAATVGKAVVQIATPPLPPPPPHPVPHVQKSCKMGCESGVQPALRVLPIAPSIKEQQLVDDVASTPANDLPSCPRRFTEICAGEHSAFSTPAPWTSGCDLYRITSADDLRTPATAAKINRTSSRASRLRVVCSSLHWRVPVHAPELG